MRDSAASRKVVVSMALLLLASIGTSAKERGRLSKKDIVVVVSGEKRVVLWDECGQLLVRTLDIKASECVRDEPLSMLRELGGACQTIRGIPASVAGRGFRSFRGRSYPLFFPCHSISLDTGSASNSIGTASDSIDSNSEPFSTG